MYIRKGLAFAIVTLVVGSSIAQHNRPDTIPTKMGIASLLLDMDIPAGIMEIKSSGVCGSSVVSLQKTSSIHFDIDEPIFKNGFAHQKIRAEYADELHPKSVTPHVQKNVTARLATANHFSAGANLTNTYMPDPAQLTELRLNLGSGKSRLDLSDMSLSKVSVKSALSDINLFYYEPNQIDMEKMELHAIRANISIKNLEFAKAKMVNIQNDAGNVRVYLGNGCRPREDGNIVVNAGVGRCYLMIHPGHPVQIVLNNGFFSGKNVMNSFKVQPDGTYVNSSFQKNNNKGTTIICNVDFGKVFIKEVEQK